MKIFGNMPGVTPVYNAKSRVGNAYGASEIPAQKKDELALSPQARDFATVMRALRNVPDVREEKVAALSGPVQDGTYDVPAADVTDKIIASLSAKRI